MPDRRKTDELRQLGERIREARIGLKMTQQDLANEMGKSAEAIASYERGTRAIPILELPSLARALDVPIDYFFDPDPENELRVLVRRIVDLRGSIQTPLRFFLMEILDYLESEPPSAKKRFSALYALFYMVLKVSDYDSAVAMVPDYRK